MNFSKFFLVHGHKMLFANCLKVYEKDLFFSSDLIFAIWVMKFLNLPIFQNILSRFNALNN